jgi:serine/threonine protein kinase/tetratricopeptide (TPR) repeat protein
MQPGDILDDRFKIERLAGSGGMGHVYRALDLRSGEPAALKQQQCDLSPEAAQRFESEAQLLAELRHPHVVRYITHGTTEHGERYLAMEWLDGENLADRLSRDRLTVTESITLGLCVAEALGAVHAQGIVHRDLKPDNLFLQKGAIHDLKLLDFGIARLAHLPRVTRTGRIVGTPGYMAPEQARGERTIDARADVFALGCILFECLTGTPVFGGQSAMAVLAKIVFAEVPPMSKLASDVPPALEALVGRMLAKELSVRPPDGMHVAAELVALRDALESKREAEGVPRAALTREEQRLLCVVLVAGDLPSDDLPSDDLPSEGAMTPTRTPPEAESLRETVQRAAMAYGARFELLADGSAAAALVGTAAATDQAAQGARCALALRALLPGRPMALAMGRGEIDGPLPVGEAIERAAGILRPVQAAHRAGGAMLIAVDELAAGLLDVRFEIVRSNVGYALSGEREGADEVRTLLGKATPFVGRDWEIASLQAIFAECRSESVARVVLVTAGAGVGKSRLRYEFLQRTRSEAVQIWMARGDPMRVGAPFGLLGQMVRRIAQLQAGEPIDARRQRLAARVARHVDGAKRARVTEFLGEMVGTPFPDEDSVQLRAARQNAMLMGDQMRRAWVDFIEAECQVQPVLLVLEDLHWGDLSTVEYIDTALRTLQERPLMVLAFARPEVHELFFRLWTTHALHEMRLAELSRRTCEGLVRQVLGEAVTGEMVTKLVERSQGNAFFLEELVRAAAEGRGEGAPGTVLAMVQSRLECLAPEERRVMRAASIFGQVFWRGGAAALLDGETRSVALDALFADLEQREWIELRRETRFQGEREYMFRHALVRDVAYGMLIDDDRVLGHRLAGEWLECVSETDASVVAEHFDQGCDPGRAVRWYRRAGEQALSGNALGPAIEQAERGIVCGADPATMGALRLIQAEAHIWRGEFALAEQRGGEAIPLLEPGSVAWFSAFTQMVYAACRLGEADRIERWMVTVGDAAPLEGALRAKNTCLCAGATTLAVSGRVAAATALITAVERVTSDPSARDIEVIANLHQARTFRATALGDPGGCLAGLEASLAAFEQAGDRRNTCMTRANLGYYYGELGDYSGAEAMLRSAVADADRMGLHDVAASAQASLGQVLAYLGQTVEARVVEENAIVAIQRLGDPRLEVAARSYLAKIALLAGDPEAAEREARAAAEILESAPPLRIAAVAVRARALLGLGRTEEALSAALEAFSTLESMVRVVYAEALAASGSQLEAVTAIASARDNLLTRAAKIGDQALRERFLHSVPDNVRTLDLARRWLGEGLL